MAVKVVKTFPLNSVQISYSPSDWLHFWNRHWLLKLGLEKIIISRWRNVLTAWDLLVSSAPSLLC